MHDEGSDKEFQSETSSFLWHRFCWLSFFGWEVLNRETRGHSNLNYVKPLINDTWQAIVWIRCSMTTFIKEKQLIPRGQICGPGSFWGFLQSVIKPKGLQIIKSKSMFLLAKAKPSGGGGGILFSEDLSFMYYWCKDDQIKTETWQAVK